MSRVLQNVKKPWDLKDNCIAASIHATSEDYKKRFPNILTIYSSRKYRV